MTRSEQKRLAIINAAKEEFIRYGFIAANMDRVCTSAEVSKRTLYRHFESKEVLFESVLTIIQESVQEKASYPFDPEISAYEQLKAISRKEVDILYHYYGIPLTRVILIEFLRQPDMGQAIITKLYNAKALAGWFAGGIEAGKLSNMTPELFTNTYSSLFNGMFLWPQVFEMRAIPEGKDIDDNIEHVVNVVLGACGVE
ncbi:TetR/AcrR family transcriptional regulator [Enterovibrio sp. ZSDZ42]|uniref:TetR/AcrR family transcriptional regulator n=1 Tax=Enterovibrio gelatinilyticus TaxID=2899819 RepID=A0ABT5QYC8_9GAMM|nr:TetR/AcrR family transcriptional regulator [Enterovibrio sp. ZSDZ42]MDD1793021.1 TetR/AcrR family transcriptional regulator [Enterovibrio sp. ZSDZ42]